MLKALEIILLCDAALAGIWLFSVSALLLEQARGKNIENTLHEMGRSV